MNIRCPSCETLYRVDPAKVPAGGVRARCVRCAAVIAVPADGVANHAAGTTPIGVPERATGPSVRVRAPSRAARAPGATAAPPVKSADEARRPRVTRPIFAPRASAPAVPEVAPLPPGEPETPPAPEPSPQPAIEEQAELATPSEPAPEPPTSPPVEPVTPAPVRAPAPITAAPPLPPLRPSPAPPAPAAAPSAPRTSPPPAAAPTLPPQPATKPGGGPINPFLARDPRQKARRLARALVSDMIVYQPEKRQQALAAGTIKDAFDEEIKKSWEEYVDQVGEEIANSTSYFTEALNDILAGGEKLF